MDGSLLAYCTSERQREVVETHERLGSTSLAAAELGVTARAVRNTMMKVRQVAASGGFSPEHGLTQGVATGFSLDSYSHLTKTPDGEPIWLKAKSDGGLRKEMIEEARAAMVQDLPQLPPRESHVKTRDDLVVLYPMADAHIGMYAHKAETGNDYDANIARHVHCLAMRDLVMGAPSSAEAVIAELGDFFHADNLKGITDGGGNVLDMDTRMSRVIRVGVATIRQCIESALTKHDTVHVVCSQGNHDPLMSMVLGVMLDQVYEREPRVVVHGEPTPRHYLRFGRVLLGMTHGHRTKDAELPLIMAAERSEDWGETAYRYFFRGHLHHDKRVELRGCTVEMVRTLAGIDFYHAGGAYMAGRDMRAVYLHKEYGEIGRNTFPLAMLESRMAA